MLNNFYRRQQYGVGNSDFLADAGPNEFVILILCSAFWAFKWRLTRSKYLDVLVVYGLYFLMEILSWAFPNIGTFDPYDLIAYTSGALLTILIVYAVEKTQQ